MPRNDETKLNYQRPCGLHRFVEDPPVLRLDQWEDDAECLARQGFETLMIGCKHHRDKDSTSSDKLMNTIAAIRKYSIHHQNCFRSTIRRCADKCRC